jgi:hypothetical protein
VGQFKTRVKREFEKSTSAKKAQITQERVEYNVFLFDKPPKGSKSLKIFKISLTFRFDKLSNLSKSVHTGENSQILTVSNKKNILKGNLNHYTKVQRLLSEDYPPRLELQEHEENPGFLANVLLTDESYFCHKGTFNSHNVNVWWGENPQFEHLF